MWRTAKLGDVCEVLDKLRKPITKKNRVSGEYPYYGATGIVDWVADHIFDEKLVLVGEDGAKWRVGDRTAFIAEGKYWVNNHVHVLRPIEEIVTHEWLAYYLTSIDLLPWVHGLTVPKLNQARLRSIPIPLPPLDEQRRIVGILNRAAKIERLRVRAQKLMGEFIPALFVKMFGDPVENPKGWEVAALGEVCAIVGGGTPRRNNPAYFGGAIPWATPTDVTSLKSLTIEATKETLTEAGLQESSARLVPAGTVLLTSRATIGFTAIAAVDVATNQGFANLTCRTDLVPEYLAWGVDLELTSSATSK